MFGYIIINQPEMKFKEFDVYHSYYCGLCRALKEKYGLFGQMTLSYDMTFVILLLSGLYEPKTETGSSKCIAHPFERHSTRSNCFTDYAADMNVLFSYYKCRDDWEDDKKYHKLAYAKLLEKAFHSVEGRYGDKAKRIQKLMRQLQEGEKINCGDIDRMSGLFGDIMAEIMVYREDEWEENLRKIGFFLGKFIYLMDAYEDIEQDRQQGNYNPLHKLYEESDFEEECKSILMMMMAGCSREFEKLPILEHAEILRNILYSGVWYRYEKVSEERGKSRENGGLRGNNE